MNPWRGLLALVCALPSIAAAQDVSLSLDEALKQARANSPTYRQTLNDASPAKWGVRNAYGSLLPSFTASTDLGYTGAGEANLGQGFIQQTSEFLTTSYSLALRWDLNGRALTAPAQQKALQRATDEDITGAGVALTAEISTQYLNTLQATAQVGVARQQVRRNEDFLTLAKARYRVGQATLLDVRQAEVTKGNSDVALLRAVLAENEAKLDLLRRMGVEPPVALERIALTDSFPVTPPGFQIDTLLAMAEQYNPVLRSLRAREHAAGVGVTQAKSDFFPTLTMQAGWAGFTQKYTDENLLLNQGLTEAQAQAADCQYNNSIKSGLSLGGEVPNCYAAAGLEDGGGALLPPVSEQILSQNDPFPIHYRSQPFQAIVALSLPIFTGFSRSLRLSQARAQQDDADEDVRARRLLVRSDVHARYLGLQTAFQAIAVEASSREAARDQLRLAQDRYRLGAGTALELSDAQNAVQQAEGGYINAVYAYHKAVAALEAAVGRPLR
ncbi:MAG TPA: TolC family protein [Gemmatimonadales bacterium]|jgi:outer membrane protein